jgi:hypothetical protein
MSYRSIHSSLTGLEKPMKVSPGSIMAMSFLVKMAPHEYREYEWACYANIFPKFLDLLVEGPLERDMAAL